MKLHCLSDLHLDANHQPFSIPHVDCDAVVVAGDVCEGPVKAIQWLVRQRLAVPVVYVPGNHEFYGTAKDEAMEHAREEAAKHPNIHLLQDGHIDLPDIFGRVTRFIGATLWSDYALDGEAWRVPAMMAARTMMNDHRAIRMADGGFWTPALAAAEHEVSRDYIRHMLGEPFDGPRVVVTHHAPSGQSIYYGRYRNSVLNPAYASDLDHLVDLAELWVHGHIHMVQNYPLGDGRVVANPRGYGHEDTGFDPGLVVVVPARVNVREAAE